MKEEKVKIEIENGESGASAFNNQISNGSISLLQKKVMIKIELGVYKIAHDFDFTLESFLILDLLLRDLLDCTS